MSKVTRFIIEGEWSGYHSGQRKIVHRTVHKANRKRLKAWAENSGYIRYTDGTTLSISIRDAQPREKVKEIHGYDSLINDCVYHNVTSVNDLPKYR